MQLTCRGGVSLPEYIHVDAYGRTNPAPAWILADIHKKIVSGQKRLLIEMNAFAANPIYSIMYSSEDLERFYFQYQTEALPRGESLQSFCVKNKVPYNIFQKWFKDTRKK